METILWNAVYTVFRSMRVEITTNEPDTNGLPNLTENVRKIYYWIIHSRPKFQINFVFYGKSPVWLMVLDMIIVNVFKAESNPRTINRTIYTSSMQIINAHKLMPFIFTPLWSYVYHSIYYIRYKRYGLREFKTVLRWEFKRSFNLNVRVKGALDEIWTGQRVFCWIRCS